MIGRHYYLSGAQTDPEGPAFRARFGSAGWFLETTGRTCVQLTAIAAPPAHYLNIGFRVGFQAVQPDTANPELELFGGAAITARGGPSLGGARRRGPRCA